MSSRHRTRSTVCPVRVARLQQYLRLLLAIIVLCILSSCSVNDEDHETLSGVAATGAPLIRASVTIKDADGLTVSTATDTRGAYRADVTRLHAPYVLAVRGGTVRGAANTQDLHAVATKSGTANVTPLTELLVASLVNLDPASFFANVHTTDDLDTVVITEDNITTAQDAVVDFLLDTDVSMITPVDVSAVGPFITEVFQAKRGDPMDDALRTLRQALVEAGTDLATLSARLIDTAN